MMDFSIIILMIIIESPKNERDLIFASLVIIRPHKRICALAKLFGDWSRPQANEMIDVPLGSWRIPLAPVVPKMS
jgi:hypothetical protein